MTNPMVGHFTLAVQALAELPALETAHDHILADGSHRLKDELFHRDRLITDVWLAGKHDLI